MVLPKVFSIERSPFDRNDNNNLLPAAVRVHRDLTDFSKLSILSSRGSALDLRSSRRKNTMITGTFFKTEAQNVFLAGLAAPIFYL